MPGCPGVSPGSPAAHTARPSPGKGAQRWPSGIFLLQITAGCFTPQAARFIYPSLTLAHLCLLARLHWLPSGGSCKLFSSFSLLTAAPPAPSCPSRSRELRSTREWWTSAPWCMAQPLPAGRATETTGPGGRRSHGSSCLWKDFCSFLWVGCQAMATPLTAPSPGAAATCSGDTNPHPSRWFGPIAVTREEGLCSASSP